MDAEGEVSHGAVAEDWGEAEKQWFPPFPKPSPRWGEGFCDSRIGAGATLSRGSASGRLTGFFCALSCGFWANNSANTFMISGLPDQTLWR